MKTERYCDALLSNLGLSISFDRVIFLLMKDRIGWLRGSQNPSLVCLHGAYLYHDTWVFYLAFNFMGIVKLFLKANVLSMVNGEFSLFYPDVRKFENEVFGYPIWSYFREVILPKLRYLRRGKIDFLINWSRTKWVGSRRGKK